METCKNVLLAGVGGQGTVLASKLLSEGLAYAGYDVKMSETHGMAQRGGSVVSFIRYGEKVYSPIISKGAVDLLVGFEMMEALRWIDYVRPEGTVIVNRFRTMPSSVLTGKMEYPDGILEEIQKHRNTVIIDGEKTALALGNLRTMNIVLLGSLVKYMELTSIDWATVLKQNLKPSIYELNQKAFDLGMTI